ncbi:TlpA disulfide reductase family protein [soil metagenome]
MISRGILAGAMLAAAAWGMPAGAHQIVVGEPAPNFRLRLAGGGDVSLADLKGQVVVLNFWATWCGPCKQEMPGLDLMQVNGGKYGLHVFGVLAMDPTPVYQLRPLGKLLHYPLVASISGGYGPIGNAVPTNYIIDRDGVVRYAKATALTSKEFADILSPLLAKPAGPIAIAEQTK